MIRRPGARRAAVARRRGGGAAVAAASLHWWREAHRRALCGKLCVVIGEARRKTSVRVRFEDGTTTTVKQKLLEEITSHKDYSRSIADGPLTFSISFAIDASQTVRAVEALKNLGATATKLIE